MPNQHDPTRTTSSQPYRVTKAAQPIARRLRVTKDGRTVTLRPLADVLSPHTRATLAAIAKGGRTNGR